MRFLPVCFLLFLGIQGCKDIQTNDLVGTWTLKDSSRKSLPAELQNTSAKIVLNGNGTFAAFDMPGLFYFPGLHAAQLESGKGVWKLISRHGEQEVQLDFQVIADWKEDLPFGTQLDVSSDSLFYFLGDADEGQRIAFEKK